MLTLRLRGAGRVIYGCGLIGFQVSLSKDLGAGFLSPKNGSPSFRFQFSP